MTTPVPYVELNNGTKIPQVGFGLLKVPDTEAEELVLRALEAGYRSIDTATRYGNERGVGKAVNQSGVKRADLFITTKLWNTDQGARRAREAFDRSLDTLQLDYVDLYLIHWPCGSDGLFVETWETFQEFLSSGRAKAIGVSNFLPEQLETLAEQTGATPSINQIELHPGFGQAHLRQVHAHRGIATEAWSPLAQGRLTDDVRLREIAAHHDRSIPQIALRWSVQHGNIVIPKSSTSDRMRQNLTVFDFVLSAEEMSYIDSLENGERVGPDPRLIRIDNP